jgi:non-specific serine/threonine protein kinase
MTGLGGVGKTRVALAVARGELRYFTGGVAWVELADVQDPSLLDQHTANRVCGAGSTGTSPREALRHALDGAPTLLVLDNCEHLLAESAALAVDLLRAAPSLRVLATSRQALGIPGEHLIVVPPLPVPAPEQDAVPGLVSSHASVALFARRAADFSPGFEVDVDNQEAVARLCRELEGIPLAIELASSMVRVLSVDEIVDRLGSQLDLGSGGRPEVERHRSLNTTISWGHALCTPSERLLWARASVFIGGFTVAAAEQVCGYGELAPEEVLACLMGLVDKSVLVRADIGTQVRFRLLEPIREFGLARLGEHEEPGEVRGRHLAWCRGLIARAVDEWFGPHQDRWLGMVRADLPNLRAAFEFALWRPELHLTALEMVGDPWFLWIGLYLGEGRKWLDQALDRTTGNGPERTKALATAVYVATHQGDLGAATAFLASALASPAEGNPQLRAYVQHMSALTTLYRDPEGALAACVEALDRYSGAVTDAGLPVGLRIQYGVALVFCGDLENARVQLGLACGECEAVGEKWLHSHALYGLGLMELVSGEPAEALALTRRAMETKDRFRDDLGLALCSDLLGWARTAVGDAWNGAVAMGVADRVWERVGLRLLGAQFWLQLWGTAMDSARTQLGERSFRSAFDLGRSLSAADSRAAVLGAAVSGADSAQTSRLPGVHLTRREREVADLVADGLSNREIAHRLGVAQRTAEGHVENILAKLGYRSRSQVAAWVAARAGTSRSREPGPGVRSRG